MIYLITKRATQDMLCDYKLALLLYRTFNDTLPEDEWLHLNFNSINTMLSMISNIEILMHVQQHV